MLHAAAAGQPQLTLDKLQVVDSGKFAPPRKQLHVRLPQQADLNSDAIDRKVSGTRVLRAPSCPTAVALTRATREYIHLRRGGVTLRREQRRARGTGKGARGTQRRTRGMPMDRRFLAQRPVQPIEATGAAASVKSLRGEVRWENDVEQQR